MITGFVRLSGTYRCHDCDPALPATFYATLAGLSSDFAQFNGKQSLTWRSSCRWDSAGEMPYVILNWNITGSGGNYPGWSITCATASGCLKTWTGPLDGCVPSDTYDEWYCDDDACNDEQSCANSAGATCVVSLT